MIGSANGDASGSQKGSSAVLEPMQMLTAIAIESCFVTMTPPLGDLIFHQYVSPAGWEIQVMCLRACP
jgi:hypothetical protein